MTASSDNSFTIAILFAGPSLRATMLIRKFFWLVIATASLSACSSRAQDNYEIQVYGSDMVREHETMVELHSNFTIDGRKGIQDGLFPTDHAQHETIEITHGFSEWAEIGFYIFTYQRNGYGVQWVGDHIRPRVRIPPSWKWPVGLSISNEVGYQRRQFSVDTWTWEMRPIVDRQLGRWYLGFNPTFDKAIHGQSVHQGFVFSPNVKFSYDFTKKFTAGIEYYGSTGPATQFLPLNQQQHQIFPTIDLNLDPRWEINFGVGVGVTRSTDHLIAKMIIGYRFNYQKPRTAD